MDTLSISFVVHEVIYVQYTCIHKDICYSGNFSAYLDVHLVHISIYIYSILIYEPSQRTSGMFDVSIRHEVIQRDDLVRTITSDDVSWCFLLLQPLATARSTGAEIEMQMQQRRNPPSRESLSFAMQKSCGG